MHNPDQDALSKTFKRCSNAVSKSSKNTACNSTGNLEIRPENFSNPSKLTFFKASTPIKTPNIIYNLKTCVNKPFYPKKTTKNKQININKQKAATQSTQRKSHVVVRNWSLECLSFLVLQVLFLIYSLNPLFEYPLLLICL